MINGDRPNIVLILADDLGWRDLGCYGSTFYETPNIDRLAAAGTRFTQSYAAAPVCSPTRASLLTGRYPARVGLTNWVGGHAVGQLQDVPTFQQLPQQEYSFARALADQGYRTWHVGKWHLGGGPATLPEAHGFDLNIGGSARGMPQDYFAPYGIEALEDATEGEFLTERLTDAAVDLIRDSDDTPFYLNLWHYAVHTPLQAPAELVEKYRRKAAAMGLNEDAVEDGGPMPSWHLRQRRILRRTAQSHPVYAAMVETLDHSVGRIVEALRAHGKLDNTMIVFTSDNGGLATSEGSPTCNAPLAEGKGWMADGGIRVPTIAHWPGRVPAGVESELIFSSPDFYPTLLSAAGLSPVAVQHVDGLDLWPMWCGDPGDRGPIFWHYPHYSNQGDTPSAAVRDGRWKLIRYFEDGRQELYDLETDLSEATDRSSDHPAEITRLGQLLDRWLTEVGARIPPPNPYADSGPWSTGPTDHRRPVSQDQAAGRHLDQR